jgi:hypothetical protein
VSLVEQARADEGELFSANAVIGRMLMSVVALVHLLLLLAPFPRYREAMHV